MKMDAANLHLSIDYLGSSGIILSTEQKASLQTSLTILQNNQKFARVVFWGKIIGIKDNYYIVQGIQDDEFSAKKVLYSKDCVKWGLLNPPTEEILKKARLLKGRFTGDPSYECTYRETKRVLGAEEESEEEEVITIKEEDRLAAVIADIDHNVQIVPRGALIKTPVGKVIENRSFEGLSVIEAAKLCNYMHFRKAEKTYDRALLQRANLEKSIDFMDAIEDDVPKGSWSIQFDRGSGLVLIKSLLWLGYIFFHVPGTTMFGSVYAGTAEMNIDLPFML